MNSHFLSTKDFISGKIISLFEKRFLKKFESKKNQNIDNKDVKFIQRFHTGEGISSVGVVKTEKKNYVIKSLKYQQKSLQYYHFLNEVAMLKMLSQSTMKNNNLKIRFPMLHDFKDFSNELRMTSEYIEGKLLKRESNLVKIETLNIILNDLRTLSKSLENNIKQSLPIRTSLYVFLSFPIYLALAIFKDYKHVNSYINFSIIFLKNFLFSLSLKNNYVLSHKDLHSKNIILKDKKIVILDTEVSVLADPETDIAHIVRYYCEEFSTSELITLLKQQLKEKKQIKRFIALTLFYSIQMIAIADRENKHANHAKNYLFNHFANIQRQILANNKRTLAEKVYYSGLTILSKFVSILSIKAKPVILCYHSISNDGWRYSTSIKDFTEQIEYLFKHKKIVPVDQIIKETKTNNRVTLAFDDGYKDFLTNALPILKEKNITGILFVLGTPDNANRKALDNKKEFLSLEEIKQIKKLGWEIGFHTNTHSSLTSLSTYELYKEIIEGKQSLEKKLGFKLRYFAYPMGEYSQKVIDVVKKAGFEAAFSTNGGAVSTKNVQNMHIIDRVCLEGNLSQTQFQTLITRAGLHFSKLFISLLKIKTKIIK